MLSKTLREKKLGQKPPESRTRDFFAIISNNNSYLLWNGSFYVNIINRIYCLGIRKAHVMYALNVFVLMVQFLFTLFQNISFHLTTTVGFKQ